MHSARLQIEDMHNGTYQAEALPDSTMVTLFRSLSTEAVTVTPVARVCVVPTATEADPPVPPQAAAESWLNRRLQPPPRTGIAEQPGAAVALLTAPTIGSSPANLKAKKQILISVLPKHRIQNRSKFGMLRVLSLRRRRTLLYGANRHGAVPSGLDGIPIQNFLDAGGAGALQNTLIVL